jgi:hypothetical protein
MSKRMQVLIEDAEFRLIKQSARRAGQTVAEVVRQALRGAIRARPARAADKKLAVMRAAAAGSFPTADIEVMLSEIEQGYAVQRSDHR